MFQLDDVKNEALSRDFLNVKTWQRQKRTKFGRLPQFSKLATEKAKQFCKTSFKKWWASYQWVLRFFHSTCLKYCQVTCSAAPVAQNHLSKPEDLMPQNATPFMNSEPWPPDTSGCACHTKYVCALFRHLNFQKCCEHGVLCAFSLRNRLRATTECTLAPFATS